MAGLACDVTPNFSLCTLAVKKLIAVFKVIFRFLFSV